MEAATTAAETETQAEHADAPAGAATGAPTPAESPDEQTGDERDEGGRDLSREAASYRRRLRETETERDQLRAQLDRIQTAEVERLASAAGLQVPGDVWTFGAELANLRGEDGGIDTEAVNGLVGEIVKDRPGLAARPVGDLGIGRGASAAGMTHTPEVGLSQLLKPGWR
jgi:hypothetical protein